MRTNHQEHLLNAFSKRSADLKKDISAEEDLSETQLEIMKHFNITYYEVEEKNPMTPELQAKIVVIEKNYRTKFFDEIKKNLTPYLQLTGELDKEAKAALLKIDHQLRIWMFDLTIISGALLHRGDNEESFLIANMGFRKLQEVHDMVESLHPSIKKLLSDLIKLIHGKFFDFKQNLGIYYLKKQNYQKASNFHMQAIESNALSPQPIDWNNYLFGVQYAYLALCHTELNDLEFAYFYLYKSNLNILVKDINITDIKKIENDWVKMRYPNSYYFALNRFIDKLFSFPDEALNQEETEKLILNTIRNLLPKEKHHPELYYSIYAKIIGFIMGKQHYQTLLDELLPKLSETKLNDYRAYGEKCKDFMIKKNWKKVSAADLNSKQTSSSYKLALDKDKKQIKIEILNPAFNTNASINKKNIVLPSNNFKVSIIKGVPTVIIQCNSFADKKTPEQITELLHHLENYREDKPTVSSPQMFHQSISKQLQTPSELPSGLPSDDGKQKIKTSKKTNHETANVSAKESKEAKESKKEIQLSEAAKLGFSNQYSNCHIVPIGRNAHFPDGVYFGFFTSSGKLEKDEEEQFVNVLENGRIASKCPAIKPVRKDTFKLAPFGDHRIVSTVAQITQFQDKKRILLNFSDEHLYTHTKQKKLYGK